MEKEFVPYELALELIQLGFDEPCFAYATMEYKDVIHCGIGFKVNKESDLPTKPFGVPTWQSAFRWFREKYGLVMSIPPSEQNNLIEFKGVIYIYKQIRLGNTVDILHCKFYNSHEQAQLECLKKLIEIVKNIRL